MTREAVAKVSREDFDKVRKKCNCKIITLGGPCTVQREAEVEVDEWVGRHTRLNINIVHI